MSSIRQLFFLISMLFATAIVSQKTMLLLDEDVSFKTGLELFQKQKYASAQKQFLIIINSSKDSYSLTKIDAEYYAAVCAVELYNKDGEMMLKNFIQQHPENPKVKTAYFYLGKHNYRKKKYKEALEWFARVDPYSLIKQDRHELYFKRGYCYFDQQQYDKAKIDFYEIKDVDTKYTGPAIYYYSHIMYSERSLETALQGFLRLTKNEDFGKIVPYYIAQIYFMQEKYDDVILYATPLVDSASVEIQRAGEVSKIIGESYFKTDRYKEAIPYLKKYEKAVGNLSREDNYQLAYAFYKINEFDNAITYFQSSTTNNKEDDLIMQNAMYHLADCYLKTNKKKFARSAFYAASKLDFDPQIKEDALYSYAKLCYELSFNPFSEAIDAFKLYISNYPQSLRLDEAYKYLINAYLTTRNYPEAIKSIESIANKSEELKQAYQKITYYRASDLLNEGQIDSAIKYFEKSLVYKNDKLLSAMSSYWKGECYYRLKKYNEAIAQYQLFMEYPGAFDLPQYTICNYNIGYCYFKQNDFEPAGISFRKFTIGKNKEELKKLNDAYNRAGDSYFMLKKYDQAIEYYDLAIKLKVIDVDYALYQKALAQGVEHKFQGKIADLEMLLNNYPSSSYAAPAKYELAQTFMLVDKPNDALAYYQKIISEYPNSSYVNKALVQIGLIYFNKKEDSNALVYFDKVVKRDRKSTEAFEALSFIKKIYIAKNDVDGMKKYFDGVAITISNNMLDSITFDIGKKHYTEMDCENATKDFNQYIQKFPDGIFILDATFFKAECEYKSNYLEAALKDYQSVIAKSKSAYTEQALAKAAYITFKQGDYSNASIYYTQLELIAEYPKNRLDATIGQMRTSFYLKSFDAAIVAANRVLISEKVSSDLLDEAHLILAKSYLETEKYDLAAPEFQVVSNTSKGERAAEAKYYIAYIQFLRAEFKDSEKTVFSLINQEASSTFWMMKGMLLLADTYLAQNDYFQAKTSLQSVIENGDNADLIKQAQQKMQKISDIEKTQVPQLPTDDIQIDFKENNSFDNSTLFQDIKKIE